MTLKHGREWDYAVNKCRCDLCKAAHAQNMRGYRQRRRARGWKEIHGKWVRKDGNPNLR